MAKLNLTDEAALKTFASNNLGLLHRLIQQRSDAYDLYMSYKTRHTSVQAIARRATADTKGAPELAKVIKGLAVNTQRMKAIYTSIDRIILDTTKLAINFPLSEEYKALVDTDEVSYKVG